MKLLLIVAVLLCKNVCECLDENEGYFTIVASQFLKLNKPYQVSVQYQGYSTDKILEIGIVQNHNSRDSSEATKTEEFKNVTINGNGIKNIEFVIKERVKNFCHLKVKSITGNSYETSQLISIVKKKFAVFVQTDKPIYKPADKVQFRILLLDADTKPFIGSNVDIYITDGAGNRVKQFEAPKFKKGVYQNEFQLSNLPVHGEWTIHVKVVNEKEETKNFEVAEYVLPKFELSIVANPNANFKDGKIRATIKAKYTFGKKVKGNATITAHGKNVFENVTKHFDIIGQKDVEFDVQDELGLKSESESRIVKLFAEFTEELSGKTQNATFDVTLHPSPYKIKLIKSGDQFKPELPYEVTATVTNHDKNAPITDSKNPVKFTMKYFKTIKKTCSSISFSLPKYDYDCDQESELPAEVKEIYPENGIAKIKIDAVPDVKYFDVKVEYQSTESTISNIKKAEAKNNQFIQIESLTEKISINKPVEIKVQSNEKLKEISYQIVGKGSILDAKSLSVSNQKIFEFSFKATEEMAPKSYLIVYYISSDGEIISDKYKIEVEKNFRNYLDIQLSENKVQPGNDLQITVNTKSDSFVGLLGVDQSVLILKKGNDIEKSDVLEKLENFNEIYKNAPGFTKLYRDFKSSDAILITNAITEYTKPRRSPGFGSFNPYNTYYPYGSYHPYNPYGSFHPYSPYGGFGGSSPGYNNYNSFGGFGGSFANAAAASQSFGSPSYAAPAYAPAASFGSHSDAAPASSFGPSPSFSNFAPGSRPPSSPTEAAKAPLEKKPIEVRKEFPETWLFDSFELSPNETSKILSKKAPDTITSWIITGFAVNPTVGMGLTQEATKLNVFQPFFVSTNLPYSIKRGEVVAIPITVFNYMQDDQEVEITFSNADHEFEFVEVDEQENQIKKRKRGLERERKKKIFVTSNDGAAVRFMIRSLKVGYITIKVTAESTLAGDGVEQKLLVVPEGVTQFMNSPILIDLRNTPEFKTSIDIEIPEEVIDDSTKIEATVSGDLLGPSIENLDKLIKLPYGCGEQNMVNFVPNIVVLDYLTSVNKLTPEIKKKAKDHLETGYQTELTYKHKDGSYSAFGESDKSGSTWLTAFVIKSFNKASKYIKIENDIIDQGLNFLVENQNQDGSFSETGRILSSRMQGGASKGTALTAYILITFLENKNNEKYQTTIDKSLNYIMDNLKDIEDTYSLSVAAYALQLAKNSKFSSLKATLMEKLEDRSERKKEMKFWKQESLRESISPDSISIEMTSYALQAYMQKGQLVDAFSIGKWLITQRNENGGFQSTQDTVVGLEALALLASKVYSENNVLRINVDSDDKSRQIDVNAKNSLILQKYELPPTSRHFDITANGQGVSLFQISYRYNIQDPLKKPQFSLEYKIRPESNQEYIYFEVCTKFLPDGSKIKSDMAVMEVSLPSGFTFDTDHTEDLRNSPRVKKVETKDSDTLVIVYFDNIDADEICPEFKSYRTHSVAKQKPSPIIIYDYYDNSNQARVFYNPLDISLCDICGDESECKSACETADIKT